MTVTSITENPTFELNINAHSLMTLVNLCEGPTIKAPCAFDLVYMTQKLLRSAATCVIAYDILGRHQIGNAITGPSLDGGEIQGTICRWCSEVDAQEEIWTIDPSRLPKLTYQLPDLTLPLFAIFHTLDDICSTTVNIAASDIHYQADDNRGDLIQTMTEGVLQLLAFVSSIVQVDLEADGSGFFSK